jgi:hypothetical protein
MILSYWCQYISRHYGMCVTKRSMSIGIATSCGLDGPEIQSRWGRHFPHPSKPARHLTASFLRVKRPRRGVNHPPPSTAEVKERVELCLYFPSEPSWPVLERILVLLYLCNYSGGTRDYGL